MIEIKGVNRPIAEAVWYSKNITGDLGRLQIQIGIPLIAGPNEFLCQVMVLGLHTSPSPIWSVNPFHALCQTFQYLQFIFRDEFKLGSFFAQADTVDKTPDLLSSRTCLDTLRTMPTELELQPAAHKPAEPEEISKKIVALPALAADLLLVISKRTEERRVELIIECPIKLERGWVSSLFICTPDEVEYAYSADDSLTAPSMALRGACYQILELKRLGYEIKVENEYGKQTIFEVGTYFHKSKTPFSTGLT